MNIETAHNELYWYYNASSSELGITSSHGSIETQAWGYHPVGNYVEDRMVAIVSAIGKPISRVRRIEKVLSRLSKRDKRIIDALYGSYRYPPQLVSVFREKTGAVLFNTSVLELDKLIKLCSAKLSKKAQAQETLIVKKIWNEAEQIYNDIHNKYIEAANE
jgi:hypothetical protein